MSTRNPGASVSVYYASGSVQMWDDATPYDLMAVAHDLPADLAYTNAERDAKARAWPRVSASARWRSARYDSPGKDGSAIVRVDLSFRDLRERRRKWVYEFATRRELTSAADVSPAAATASTTSGPGRMYA